MENQSDCPNSIYKIENKKKLKKLIKKIKKIGVQLEIVRLNEIHKR
jgi:uncharacterized protein (UPF0128 family)